MRRLSLVVAASLMASATWAAPAGLQSMALGKGPTIVMIHNLGGARTGWMPTARKLLANYRVVLVDLPGHGSSPMLDPFTLDAGAAAIGQVLAAQKAESTIVVGQGMGALMALMALAAHPERARGLVAIEMSLKNQFPVPDQQRDQYFDLIEQNYDFFLRRMFTNLGRDSAQGVAIHAQASQVPPATMKAYFREMVNFDPGKAAKAVKAPLMFVATERTWSADMDSSAFASAMGYGAAGSFSLRRMTDCGFLVASEQPDSLAAIISGFAGRVLTRK